jgi:hypothetical protein
MRIVIEYSPRERSRCRVLAFNDLRSLCGWLQRHYVFAASKKNVREAARYVDQNYFLGK